MTSVAVGVHVHAEPDRLQGTLEALRRPGRRELEIMLLGDGPDAATRSALERLELPRSDTPLPQGPPACFNRLASRTTSAVVIMLESGAIPAPRALDRLVDALAADPRLGLVGPSTNNAWNEQGAFPRGPGTPAGVARTGALAARRYGTRVRDLAPLYSLSDFCLAVRREVIAAIGGADEGYGLGPCWEMEYSARVVRAGFLTAWLPGAFVYRSPFTTRRNREEAQRFDASRRRYQESLCGLRLRGDRGDYEPHCRGDQCEHFAPRDLITLHRPLPKIRPMVALAAARPTVSPTPETPRLKGATEAGGESASRARPTVAPAGAPLVSCIMPTRDRVDFALHAIGLFRRQDYEHRELIVVDDGGGGDLADRMPDDPRVRYLRAPAGESIGAKRNRACAAARGAFLAHFDDDDWYGPQRLSAQLAPLLAGRAEITGLVTPLFFELDDWRFWSITPALHRRLFMGDVHGGTLVFARRVWQKLARYPATSLAEDAALLDRARRRGARLERVDGAGHFAYLRHGSNAWRFRCGEYLDPGGWATAQEPDLPPDDRAFYAARSRRAPPAPAPPLVTAIMPTADRRAHVASSLAYFARQDHPSCELLVLDDGDDRVEDLVPADPRIRYVGLDERLVLGEKRNRACELARGEIIVHWDDDDWQDPRRISYQVAQLERHGASLCGPGSMLYFDPVARRAWLYEYSATRRSWIAGNGLCYRRALWERNPFAPVQVGEDNRFVWSPHARGHVVLEDHRLLAGLLHPTNVSRKNTSGANWRPRPLAEVQGLLGEDWARYAS